MSRDGGAIALPASAQVREEGFLLKQDACSSPRLCRFCRRNTAAALTLCHLWCVPDRLKL
jgi:hypothetical protein